MLPSPGCALLGFSPCRSRRRDAVDDPAWIFELKFDGFRDSRRPIFST
jgi:hypothetical protein